MTLDYLLDLAYKNDGFLLSFQLWDFFFFDNKESVVFCDSLYVILCRS
jgi:hypothetical protein